MARPAGAVLVLAPGPQEGADRTGGRSVPFLQERLVPAPRVTYANASTHTAGGSGPTPLWTVRTGSGVSVRSEAVELVLEPVHPGPVC